MNLDGLWILAITGIFFFVSMGFVWNRYRTNSASAQADSLSNNPSNDTLSAIHEAGHIVVALCIPNAFVPFEATIVPRTHSTGDIQLGGVVLQKHPAQPDNATEHEARALLAILMGGRIAEEKVIGTFSAGWFGDLAQATQTAEQMVYDWGMHPLTHQRSAPRRYRESFALLSDSTRRELDISIDLLLGRAFQQAQTIIEENREMLGRLSQALLTIKKLDQEQIRIIALHHTTP